MAEGLMEEGQIEEGQMAEARTVVQMAAVRRTSVTFPATTQAYSPPPIDSTKQSIYCI